MFTKKGFDGVERISSFMENIPGEKNSWGLRSDGTKKEASPVQVHTPAEDSNSKMSVAWLVLPCYHLQSTANKFFTCKTRAEISNSSLGAKEFVLLSPPASVTLSKRHNKTLSAYINHL